MIILLLLGAILSELDMLHGFILVLYCAKWVIWFLGLFCKFLKFAFDCTN